MKKYTYLQTVILSIILIFNQSMSAQEEPIANKSFYTELGGGGILMSMNYDQRFSSESKLGFGYRIGLGFGIGEFQDKYIHSEWGGGYWETKTRSYYSIPVGLNYIFGSSNKAASFEVGGGVTYLTRKVTIDYWNYYNNYYYYDVNSIYTEAKPGNIIGYLTFMFRLAPTNGGFSFRVGFTPIINNQGDLVPMGAVSVGFAF